MIIKSKQNSLIKIFKKLHKKKGRTESNLFLIEGFKLVQEALISNISIKNILYTDAINNGFIEKIQKDIPCYKIPQELMKVVSTTDNPPPIIGMASMFNLQLSKFSDLLIFLESISEPGNLGTIIRSAEAFGVGGIILNKNSVDRFNPKVIRSSAGSIFRVPVIQSEYRYLKELKDQNFNIIGLDPHKGKLSFNIELRKPILIVAGNESHGLSKNILDLIDHYVKIPMKGKIESLNISTCISIMLYEVLRRQNV